MTSGVTARVRVTLDVDTKQPWSASDPAGSIRAAAERDVKEQLRIALQEVRFCRVVGMEVAEVTLTIGGGE